MNSRRILRHIAFLFLMAVAAPVFSQTITSVVPPLGTHGDDIHIYGNGFEPGGHPPSTLSVYFNTSLSTTYTGSVIADTNINITNVPAGATTGYIFVYINGNEAQSPQQFPITSSNAYVTNFTPVSGGNGTPVTLTGVNFESGGATNVSFNGVLSQGTPNVQLYSISVTAPNGVTTGPLVVISKYGASHNFNTTNNILSAATNFFVAPKFTSHSPFSPNSGRPGTNVLISGTNFTGASAVTFDGVNALSFTVLNNNSIQATVPTTSSGPILVTTIAAFAPASSSPSNFLMLPTIYSFSPGSGPSGTVITVNGAGLNEGSPNPTVKVGDGTVTSFGTVTPTVLSFTVPATATSGAITITTTNGTVVSTQLFYLPPAISSFVPNGGGAGTFVQINGSNFTNASAVSFNGVAASGFVVTNNSIIGAIVPAGVTSGPITVTTPGGSVTSSGLFYAPPTITSFTPTHGSPGTNVTIFGVNFTNATEVLFNGVAAASFVVANNTMLTAVVPNSATTGLITVGTPGGTNASATAFTIDSADLGVSVAGAPNPVFIGSNLVYTIVVTNLGPVSAPNVILTNKLSSSVSLKAFTTSQGILNTGANPLTGFLGTIDNGASATVTLTVIPSAIGGITNVASVTSDLPDPNQGNNTTNTVTTVWPLPFLSITNLMNNGLLQISWPAPLSGFTLQFATDLTTNTAWTNDAAAKVVSGTNVSVTETNIWTSRFFRLTN